ncbi:hypothetical protein [Mycobacterium leprae]|nr:hypothetical protein [Mycobacterium leprae]
MRCRTDETGYPGTGAQLRNIEDQVMVLFEWVIAACGAALPG